MNLAVAATVAFVGALAASARGVFGEAVARSGDEVQTNAVAKDTPFNISDGLRRLNHARKLALRGGGGGGESDPAEAAAKYLHDVKDVAKDHATHLELLLHQYQDDKEALAGSLKSMIVGSQEVASLAKEAREIDPNFELPSSDVELDHTIEGFDLDAIKPDALIELIEPELLNEVAANTRHLADILDNLDLEALSSNGRQLLVEEEKGSDAFGFGYRPEANDSSDAFGFGPNQGQNWFHPRSSANSLLKKMMKGKGGIQRMKMPRNLRSHFDFDKADDKKRHRRLQENAICLPRCDPGDSMFWKCNCEALVEYATEITPYDLAVMFAQQYIETDENSNDYGSFAVNITTLDLFDADDELPEKANRISTMASEMSEGDMTENTCAALLKEFHTAVSLDQSRQLSVEEVREAVHTDIKLNVGEIAEKYDGLSDIEIQSNPFVSGGEVDQNLPSMMDQYVASKVCRLPGDCSCPCKEEYLLTFLYVYFDETSGGNCDVPKVAQACREVMDELLQPYEDEWREGAKPSSGGNTPVQCQSVSYAACATFADSFDLLYQGRNKTSHPNGNPMRKDPNQAIHPSTDNTALDLVNFPIAHTFSVDEHGVKTVTGYADAALDGFPGDKSFRDVWYVRGEENYWVACSNSDVACAFSSVQEPSTNKHNVKCCSNTAEGSNFWRMSPWAGNALYECQYTLVLDSRADSRYGTTGIGQCPPQMTHEEATEFCAGYGGRLCTSDELYDDCARGVGCAFDYELIWATEYSFQYSAETGCYSSQFNGRSTLGMEACDSSTSFLVGQSTSIGTVASLAQLVEEKGPGRMPGTCCLDNPGTSTLFGKDFDDSMECKERGDWHLGISEAVCEAAGGTWTRSHCVTLQECIASRPTNTSAGFSASFESFASQLDIDDASDEDQCGNARQRLGFDQDYDLDVDVCDEFNNRMCDPFYDDLDEATEHPDPTWKDIEYTPITYPDDPALNFTAIPPMESYKAASDDPTLNALQDLQIAQQAAWTAYQTSMYVERQYQALTSSTCAALNVVVLGDSNPAYPLCKLSQKILAYIFFIAEFLSLLAWDGVSNSLVVLAQKQTNWAKETYTLLTQHVLADVKVDGHKGPWLPKALEVINDNINTQHKQVHDELQARHTQMVNDINQETVDTANCLGCQLANDMGAECDVSKEPGCQSDSRRRLEDNFRVTWPAGDDFDGGENLWEVVKTIHRGIQQNDKMLKTIHEALEIDDVDAPTPAPAKTKRSKKAKQAKLDGLSANLFQTESGSEVGAAVEEGGARRKMMHVNRPSGEMGTLSDETREVRGKIDSIEGNFDAIEGKIEDRMDAIEEKADETKQMKEKIDAMEGKIDALMDLVMQLVETKQS